MTAFHRMLAAGTAAAVGVSLLATLTPAASAGALPQPAHPRAGAASATPPAAIRPLALVRAAVAPVPIAAAAFGMHSGSGVPGVRVGSTRLWDTGTRWAELETTKGAIDLSPLEARVTALRAAGVRDIVYVFGGTPTWAASSFSDIDIYGSGSSAHPKDIRDFERFARAVVTRFKGRITAYQAWNEANLSSFYRGTPAQMADLTLRLRRIVKAVDPRALLVAASTGTRLQSAYRKFYPAYLAELRKRGWPVDVFTGHFYPPSTGTPTTRLALVAMLKADLVKAKAPAKPLWDTEINYGLAGPGPAFPDRDIEGPAAAVMVARTYLDSARVGIARTYWYDWGQARDLLGVTMFTGSVGATTFARVYSWLAGGALRGCAATSLFVSCGFVKSRKAFVVAWTERGRRTVVVPAGARTACPAYGACVAVRAGARYSVGTMPVRFG